jgi:hypothetical protein
MAETSDRPGPREDELQEREALSSGQELCEKDSIFESIEKPTGSFDFHSPNN